MAVDLVRLTEAQILRRAATALGKVDLYGLRGVTLVTIDEIEAMAALLAICGLSPIPPGPDTRPAIHIIKKERPDAL